ncbi:hypothetical protein SOV_17390 [Sporomusa ovata DSM 2662]|uniref:Phage protein n=1 Tax=Sporomusa ovata TaxID=2378 RepID=A0A0U1KV93_9FIRM|nr:carbohydrate binding domain [Sporomusa ovata]EQB29339.1 carbohydrate binding domain [Sporomusa ovata DSM 2662]CQR71380.1 Phage protein [Sporomusa ovata]
MAVVHTIQNSFAGGEVAPAMYGRTDMAKYAVSLRAMYNCYAHLHGGVSNRPGTEFIAKARYSGTKKCRVVDFEFSTVQAYTLEFGAQYIRFYKDGGQIVIEDGTPYQVSSTYLEDVLEELTFTQSADTLFIFHQGYPPAMLTRTGHTAWTLSAFEFRGGPWLKTNTAEISITPSGTTGVITLTATADIFQAGHVGALWRLRHFLEAKRMWGTPNPGAWVASASYGLNNCVTYGGKAYFCLSDIASAIPPPSDTSHWEECSENTSFQIMVYHSWHLVTTGFWKGKLLLQQYDDGIWKTILNLTGTENKNYTESGEIDEPAMFRVVGDTFQPTNTGEAYDRGYFQFDTAASEYDGWGVVSGYIDAKHVQFTVKKDIGKAEATKDWAEGAWSAIRGYPACAVFTHDDRMMFAASQYGPSTYWMSQTSDYSNLSTSLPETLDTDAITNILVSRQVNQIRHLVALSEILALTSGSEWKIGPGPNGTAFTPTSIQARIQGYRGASKAAPVIIGNRILYVQDMGSTIRDLGYALDVDSYTGNDLSILARHLFAGYTIVSIAYQQEPDSIVWMVRDDGILLSLTYMREQDVWAWGRHETDGKFESVCAIPGQDRTEIWFVVQREVNGQAERYIERLAARSTTSDPKEKFYVDSGLTYRGDPATTISGLEHLEGKTVSILADGNVLPQQVVTGGKVTLPVACQIAHIGLPYLAEIETLNVDFPSNDGTVQGRKKRIPKVTLRLENSRGAWVGPRREKMREIKWRATENYDEAIRLFTGDKELEIYSEPTCDACLVIQQYDPLPLTVLALMAVVEFEDV